MAIDIVVAAWTAARLDRDFLLTVLFGVVLAMATPMMAGKAHGGLTLALSLSRFVPDLMQPPCHGGSVESLKRPVNPR